MTRAVCNPPLETDTHFQMHVFTKERHAYPRINTL